MDLNVSKIENLFAENFTQRGEVGAAVSIWQNGHEILSLARGWRDRNQTLPWTVDTPVLIYSVTKALASACVLHGAQERQISLEQRVAEIWPEFAGDGRDAITLAQVLAHQAGLPAIEAEVSTFDHAAVVAALTRQRPLWPPGTGHGYHPRTYGFLLDEILRRMSGLELGEYWRRHFAEPLELATWIGLPVEKNNEVAQMLPARIAPQDNAFLRAFSQAGSLTQRVFSSPRGLQSVASMNTPEARTASFPAFGGISTGRSLAKFFAMLAHGGALDGVRYFSAESLARMTTTLTSGFDQVLQIETAFSAGFMKDPLNAAGGKIRALFGPSRRAFGQPGAGGSVGFADPENGVGFAYVMNQMEPGVLPNAKALRLIEALYA